jgi:oxaloacetate decarboxylase alpha subunit
VVLPERYEVVPEEVLHYALGHYGPLMRPIEPHVADRIFSQPRVKDLEKWERDQTSLAEFRKRLGESISDEELLLRYFCPEDQVDKMLAGPPLRTEPPARSDGFGEQLTELIEYAETRPVKHFSMSRAGMQIDLRRD